MIHDKQEYEVELVVTTRHLITTYSRSVEEAISDAEELYFDGERGQVLTTDIEQGEAFPAGEFPLEDEEDEDA